MGSSPTKRTKFFKRCFEMKCQICKEKEATHKISIPNFSGNIAPNRCEDCVKRAERSYDNVKVEEFKNKAM